MEKFYTKFHNYYTKKPKIQISLMCLVLFILVIYIFWYLIITHIKKTGNLHQTIQFNNHKKYLIYNREKDKTKSQ